MLNNLHNKLDDDFKKIGEFGPYQLIVFILVGLTACIPAILAYGYVFIGALPEFRCRLPEVQNDSYSLNHQYLIDKYLFKIKDKEYDKCYIKHYDSNLNYYGNASLTEFSNLTMVNYTRKKCDSWVFSDKYYGKTIVTDHILLQPVERMSLESTTWHARKGMTKNKPFYYNDQRGYLGISFGSLIWHLICSNATKKSTFSTLYFVGTYGVLFSGILSDKLGRKLCTYVFIIANAIVAILMAIITNMDFSLYVKEILYGILRLITGITSNTYSVAFVLAVEITGPSYRILAANSLYYFYILGEYVVVLLCYFIRDYDQLYLWLAGIMALFPLYFWTVPESPRWLLTKGKYNKAYKVLKRIADSNKKELPEVYGLAVMEGEYEMDENDKMLDSNIRKPLGFFETIKKVVQSKKLFFRTVSIAFNWFSNNFVYYGLTLGTGQLAGNPYLNFTLLATNELIAIILSQFIFEKIGRKMPYIINMAVAGVALLIAYFIPETMPFMITILALIGKFTISFTFNGIYIITSELYPTIIRTTVVAFCQCIARLGGVIAPYVNLLGEEYWRPLPFILYGACAAISSILTFVFIPETKNRPMTDTL